MIVRGYAGVASKRKLRLRVVETVVGSTFWRDGVATI